MLRPVLWLALILELGCSHEPLETTRKTVDLKGKALGTTWTVKIHSADSFDHAKLRHAIATEIEQNEKIFSHWRPDCKLHQFNQAFTTSALTIHPKLHELLRHAAWMHRETNGTFDPTIAPLVNLWGFGPDKSLKDPSTEALAKAKTQVGTDKLLLSTDDLTLQKKHPELFIDLSAIAKGYAVDQVGLLLEKHGLESYLVEIGGEIRARGRNLNGAVWHLGIEKPHILPTREVALVVPLDDLSMATTGNYRNYYLREDGRKVSHAIDARTAEPVESPFSSVTVLHKDCMRADALATGFFALGREDGLKIAEEHKLAVLYVEPAGESYEVFASSTFPMFHTK